MTEPLLYEINTRCWLRELSERERATVTLANVPAAEVAGWGRLGFTHIWLMGVWTTGPQARAEALQAAGLREAYGNVLPDWKEADVAGSPYAIADYRVPAGLGGEEGLKSFRQELHRHGMKLLLDFVPNHLGLDHRWVRERPELFVQSPTPVADSFAQETSAGVRWLAHGKDPYFPGWTDTAQLDYRQADTREAMTELLQSVAARCDGVRCDMAMLLLNEVFARTWERWPSFKAQASSLRETGEEFWRSAIAAVKAARRDFLFLSEVYWGLEGRLQELGFDYTYDKELYDKLVGRDAARVQGHLLGLSREFVAASAHFLENHDEARVAARLTAAEQRAAALVILGLPGMRFLHEGQLTGARMKIPVQLARRPVEDRDPEVARIYEQLLTVLRTTGVAGGTPALPGRGKGGELLRPRAAWPDNPTGQNFVIVQWQNEPLKFDLVVANLAPHRSQCYVSLNVEGLSRYNWSMANLLGDERYARAGEDLESQGLYLDLPAHGAQVFLFEVA